MNFGLHDKKAIVCGASKGLGLGCAQALAGEGVELFLVARNEGPLKAAADAIVHKYSVPVTPIVADVTLESGRDRILSACPAADILINNAGGPPPGDFRDWGQKEWFDAVNANMYSAIDMIRRTLDGMVDRRFGRIVNITSFSVKEPMPALGLSNGARAGLIAFVAGISRQYVQHNVTINNALPGFFDTDRGRAVSRNMADKTGMTEEAYLAQHRRAGRLGTIEEFGALCAYLCSRQAGYMTGQNLLIDGGDYGGTF